MGELAYDLLKLVAELVVLWMSASFLIKWHKSRPVIGQSKGAEGTKMLFGDAGISSQKFAEEFTSAVLEKMGTSTPPCCGGEKTPWSDEIFHVLEKMGNDRGFECYLWLVDRIWWSNENEHMGLAVESELDTNAKNIEEDFQKLTVMKCPLKVLIYSAVDPGEMKTRAEKYLRKRDQHVKDEKYLLIAFTAAQPQCFRLKIPVDGRSNELSFEPLQLSIAQATA